MKTTNNAEQLLYQLFTDDIPLMDVRAPVEFLEGAFPESRNYPLLDDQQRHQVGKTYKDDGQDEAIKLGLKLVSNDVKQQRLDDWKKFIIDNPKAYLYCFRGGLRSRTTQQWLVEQGVDIPLIAGGYKAMRRYLINQIEAKTDFFNFFILAGQTGTGKTELLLELENSVDLEGLANHRGSSFGAYVDEQPTQINFENNLAVEFLKKHKLGFKSLVLEDEGFLVGKRLIPKNLFAKMKNMPLVVLQVPLKDRIEVTLNDYIISNYMDFTQVYKDNADNIFSDYLINSLDRIKKRLGGVRHKQVLGLMNEAIVAHLKNNDIDGHRQWIKILMQDYYDPMYQYQLDKKKDRIVYSGNKKEVKNWLLIQNSA
jgi:tRNA 2-selenouridine synthase